VKYTARTVSYLQQPHQRRAKQPQADTPFHPSWREKRTFFPRFSGKKVFFLLILLNLAIVKAAKTVSLRHSGLQWALRCGAVQALERKIQIE